MTPREIANEFKQRYHDSIINNKGFDFVEELTKLIDRIQKEKLPPKRKYTKRTDIKKAVDKVLGVGN